MNIKIKAIPVDLRHKLSQIALFYGIEEARIVSKLSKLADAELVFAHDFKRLPSGDYMLSSRALALIFVNGHKQVTPAAFEDLAAFLIRTVGSDRAEDCLMTDYLLARTFEIHQIVQNRQEDRHQQFEKTIGEFMEVVTPLNGFLH